MSRSAVAIVGIAMIVSLGLRLSVRIAAHTNIDLLPARHRSRIQWWQGNEHIIQVGCALVAVGTAGAQFATAVG